MTAALLVAKKKHKHGKRKEKKHRGGVIKKVLPFPYPIVFSYFRAQGAAVFAATI